MNDKKIEDIIKKEIPDDDMTKKQIYNNSDIIDGINPEDITEEDIYEGNPGIYALPCEEIIPPKAKCIHQTKSFEFSTFVDQKTQNGYFGIKVMSYHSGELKISVSMLEKLVEILKKK